MCGKVHSQNYVTQCHSACFRLMEGNGESNVRCVVLCRAVMCCDVLCCVVSCRAVMCCDVLYCVVSCCDVL